MNDGDAHLRDHVEPLPRSTLVGLVTIHVDELPRNRGSNIEVGVFVVLMFAASFAALAVGGRNAWVTIPLWALFAGIVLLGVLLRARVAHTVERRRLRERILSAAPQALKGLIENALHDRGSVSFADRLFLLAEVLARSGLHGLTLVVRTPTSIQPPIDATEGRRIEKIVRAAVNPLAPLAVHPRRDGDPTRAEPSEVDAGMTDRTSKWSSVLGLFLVLILGLLAMTRLLPALRFLASMRRDGLVYEGCLGRRLTFSILRARRQRIRWFERASSALVCLQENAAWHRIYVSDGRETDDFLVAPDDSHTLLKTWLREHRRSGDGDPSDATSRVDSSPPTVSETPPDDFA